MALTSLESELLRTFYRRRRFTPPPLPMLPPPARPYLNCVCFLQGMILRLRQSAAAAPPPNRNRQALESGIDVGLGLALESIVKGADDGYALSSGGASPPPPPPSTLFSARLLHALTCLVELCGNCPATPSLAADLLGLAWLLRGPASGSRELRRYACVSCSIVVAVGGGGAG